SRGVMRGNLPPVIASRQARQSPPRHCEPLGVAISPRHCEPSGVAISPRHREALGVAISPRHREALGVAISAAVNIRLPHYAYAPFAMTTSKKSRRF
ncbi:MAG: hypothetical protein IJY21_02560, partial [Clostridia bacterium]|nr:hypothetical protein [Clostridia bacterium]